MNIGAKGYKVIIRARIPFDAVKELIELLSGLGYDINARESSDGWRIVGLRIAPDSVDPEKEKRAEKIRQRGGLTSAAHGGEVKKD